MGLDDLPVGAEAVPVEPAAGEVALAQGGHDNISACVARLGVVEEPEPAPAASVIDGDLPTAKLPPPTPPGAGRVDPPNPPLEG